MEDKRALRRQDFWTAIVMIVTSLFFLYQTSSIPFFRAAAAGVDARWYNSAALVPYLVFAALLALSIALLVTAIAQGGAPVPGQMDAAVVWATSTTGGRIIAAAIIMLFYIFALVPRVDFIICSALVLLAMIGGFHQMRARATLLAVICVAVPSVYALAAYFPQSEWSAPHDDDWAALASFVGLLVLLRYDAPKTTRRDGFLRWAPLVAILVPFALVLAMAFGFRQNVPNRTGLLFQQIEYHYFVNIRPLWRG